MPAQVSMFPHDGQVYVSADGPDTQGAPGYHYTGLLRGQDKVLMSQFQRCQESIEQLKRQRPWYEVYSDDEEEEAEAEGGKHWEDWEIEDFDRSQAHSVRKETLEPVAKDSTRKKFITTDFNINQNTHQATD